MFHDGLVHIGLDGFTKSIKLMGSKVKKQELPNKPSHCPQQVEFSPVGKSSNILSCPDNSLKTMQSN